MAAVKTDRPGSTVTLVDTNGNSLDFTRLPLRAAPGDEAGLYAFAGRDAGPKRSGFLGWLAAAMSRGKEKPVYIGEADSLMTRLERHELLDEARAMGATALWIHFTPKTLEGDRKRMVQSLVKVYQPALNKPRLARSDGEASGSQRTPSPVKALEGPKQPPPVEEPVRTGAYRRREMLLQGRGDQAAALPSPDQTEPRRIGSA
jgi:hypothetical protein